jgi:hypothetical protein
MVYPFFCLSFKQSPCHRESLLPVLPEHQGCFFLKQKPVHNAPERITDFVPWRTEKFYFRNSTIYIFLALSRLSGRVVSFEVEYSANT